MQSEQNLPEMAPKVSEPEKPLKKVEKPKKEESKERVKIDSIVAMMNVVARILAVRLFLFLSIIGSFILALIADSNQSLQSVIVVVLFASVTTLPLTILEWKNRNGS
jgi:hypothetical protein